VQAGSLHLQPGERLPVTLEALVADRLRGLSPESRRGLAVAAALSQPTLAVVDAVAGDGALAGAEEAQVVHVRDGAVRFTHRCSPRARTPRPTRRRGGPCTPRSPRASASPRSGRGTSRSPRTGPDDAVASALDDAGRRAVSRGAPAAAAELFERAVQLTPPGHPAEVGRRRTDAARCAFQSGDGRRARELLDEVLRTTGRGPARARALVLMALLRGYDDDLRAAEALLREAIENAEGDEELQADAHQQLGAMLFRLRERLREAVERTAAAAASERDGLRAEALGTRLLAEERSATPARRTRCGRCSSSTPATARTA
jgi:tetratricopeptide (TPR) repeat protein